MTFVNSHQNTVTSHISLTDTNINNITGHGNTITTILTDIADLQAGAGASWTTAEKTTIQADVSTLYTNDTNYSILTLLTVIHLLQLYQIIIYKMY